MDPKLLEQIKQYLKDSGLSARELEDRMNAIKASTVEFNRELVNAQRHFDELNSDFNDLSQQFKNVLDDLRKWDSTSSRINQSFKKLGGLADKLKYDAQDISRLSAKDLDSLEKQARVELSNLVARKKELDTKFAGQNLDRLERIARERGLKDTLKQLDQYRELKSLIDDRGQLIGDENNYIKTLNALLAKRQQEEKDINKTLGISGKIVDGIVESLGKLGISSDFFEGLKEDMREVAKSGDKWKVFTTGIKGIVKGIGESLKDPITQLTILLKIANFFFQAALNANDQAVKLGKSLGYAGGKADSYRENLAQIARISTNIFVTTANLSEAFGELATATGFAYEFTADQLTTQIKLTKQVGLTAEEAAQVQRFAVLNNKTSEETYRSFLKGITASRNQLKVGIDFKATLAEAVKVSGQLAAQLGNNPELIGKAIVTAKALGMTLEQVAKAGSTLLDFGSSISSELEAELLTGKQINLERARAAALAGDQITLAEELAKNMGTAADFTKLNKLQQDSLAKSIGMSSDELAETLRKREEALASGKSLAQVTEEEAAKALERTTIQDKFNQAILKLQGFIGDLVAGPLGSFIDILTDALSLVNLIALPFAYIYKFTSMIGNGIGGWLDGLGVVGKVIKGIASGLIIAAAYSAFAGLADSKLLNIVPFGGYIAGAAAAAAITSAGFGLLNSSKGTAFAEGGIVTGEINNATVGEAGPEVIIPLNSPKADKILGGGSMPQIDLTPMIMAINEVRSAVDRLYSKDQSINMDGKKVGTTLVQNSYKVA